MWFHNTSIIIKLYYSIIILIIWSLSLTWTVASSLRVIPWIPRQRKGLGSTSCGNMNHKSRTFKHWELDSKLSSTSEQRDLQNVNIPISSTHASKAEGCKYDLSCMFIAQVFYKIPLKQERLPTQLLDRTKSNHCPKRFAEEPRASLKLHGMYFRFMTPALTRSYNVNVCVRSRWILSSPSRCLCLHGQAADGWVIFWEPQGCHLSKTL
jgi:hypothetical protein